MNRVRITFISSIFDIEPAAWDALWSSRYPFARHAFFAALEISKSTLLESGWQPCHLLVWQDIDCADSVASDSNPPEANKAELISCCPLFIKTHSYGEYVFDWSWADAYQQAGLEYYPKLLNAIPFTPATGERIGFQQNTSENTKTAILHLILDAIKVKAKEINASSFHCLFPESTQSLNFSKLSETHRLHQREGCQFHWFNADYENFDDFLNECVSRKRKMIRKERKKVLNQGIDISMNLARDVSEADWKIFYALYHRTYLKRSGRPGYLGEEFFTQLAKDLPDQLILAKAVLNEQFIAGAVYFRDDTTLYGRYWGTMQDIDGLHFETCYYQGIEYAIKHKLQRFDPGAQGEHKIQRGFIPKKTVSYHWLKHNEFSAAVGDFVKKEREHNALYINDTSQYLPFNENAKILEKDL